MFPKILFRPLSKVSVVLVMCAAASVSASRVMAESDQDKSHAVPPQPVAGGGAGVAQLVASARLETEADGFMAIHQYLAAIHLYEAIPSPTAPLLNKTGIAYEKMRLFPQAKASYERALATNPKFSGPENNLGTVYYATGDYRRAEQHYKRALKKDPRNASIYNNLGTLYFMKRKIHRGAEAYQQALSLDPEIFERNAANGIQTEGSRESRALINFYLAQTCAEAGKNEAAMGYLRRAVDAGFHDKAKLREDAHFALLRGTPEFKSLLFSVEHANAPEQVVQ